jgi:hypothetical protein
MFAGPQKFALDIIPQTSLKKPNCKAKQKTTLSLQMQWVACEPL